MGNKRGQVMDSGWLKVEDEMPEAYADVLAVDGDGVVAVAWADDEIAPCWHSRNLEFNDEVTHWRPLPDPPNE